MRKFRMPVAFGLMLALAGTGVAFGGGPSGGGSQAASSDVGVASNHVDVDLRANTTPRKMKRFKFTNRQLAASVGHDNSDGSDAVPPATKAVQIDFGKNIKFRPNRPPKCRANLDGTTTEEARQLCPGRTIIGSGKATVRLLVGPGVTQDFDDFTTLAIAGPAKNRLRFHAYSPTIGVTQVIPAIIRPNAPGKAFNWRLNVPNVPEIVGATGANTLFGVTIRRGTGVVQARCALKRMRYRAFWTFREPGDPRQRDLSSHPCRRG